MDGLSWTPEAASSMPEGKGVAGRNQGNDLRFIRGAQLPSLIGRNLIAPAPSERRLDGASKNHFRLVDRCAKAARSSVERIIVVVAET